MGHYLLGSSDNIRDQLSGEKKRRLLCICLDTGVETVKIKVLGRVLYNKNKINKTS
jgi:hypothetical protein